MAIALIQHSLVFFFLPTLAWVGDEQGSNSIQLSFLMWSLILGDGR